MPKDLIPLAILLMVTLLAASWLLWMVRRVRVERAREIRHAQLLDELQAIRLLLERAERTGQLIRMPPTF